jgi:hypothetical protein
MVRNDKSNPQANLLVALREGPLRKRPAAASTNVGYREMKAELVELQLEQICALREIFLRCHRQYFASIANVCNGSKADMAPGASDVPWRWRDIFFAGVPRNAGAAAVSF